MEDLKELNSEIKAERKLLEDIVDNISSFVETYQNIKFTMNDLKGAKDFDIKTAVEQINKSLVETNTSVGNYCKELEDTKGTSKEINAQVDKLKNNIEKTNEFVNDLNNKLKSFLDTQTKALSSIAKLDEYMSNIKNIDFESLDNKITKYSNQIDNLDKIINTDIKSRIEINTTQITKIETNINRLMEKISESDISALLREIQTTNSLISETQKEKFALNQDLDIELNAWADRNGVKRKRK